jgi:large exoprotein involved in heme utilization and adhesion
VVDGGVLSTTTFGRGSAGNIAVTATEQVLVQGTSDPQGDSTGPTGGPSILISSAENSQVGSGPRNAGDIVVKTPILMVEDGGKISTSTLGGGQGGDIRVEGLDNQPAAAVTIEGEGPYGSSILEARTEGAGNAGEVEITTPVLTVRDGARISTDTRGIGNGGNIEITATGGTVVLQGSGTKGRSSLEASTSFSTGNAGDVTITTQDLRVEDGAEINSRTTGSGRGGNIRVEATNITVRGEVSEDRTPSFPDNIGLIDNDGFVNSGQVFIGSGFRTSGLRAQTKNTGGNTGPGGTITIETKTLTLADGGELNASTFSRGPAGSITLHVDSLNAGSNAEISSKSTLTSSGSGQAGNIVVQGLASPATSVSLTNSSLLTSVSGDGSGGSIMVETGVLTLDNATVSASVKNIPAGSDPTQGVGNVTLSATQEALITNGTVVTAQSDGTRHAGNVTIQAGNQFLSTNSRVTTEANATDADASGGSITVNAQDVIRLRDTTISASVSGNETTSGGNISIDPSLLLMQNSQIIAKASKGQGGNITIIAGTVLADASSSISASSQSGPQGTVNVQAPIQNLSGAMVPMPQAFKATTNLLAERCAARVNAGNTSTFAITTREGLPPEPGGPLSTPLEELDLAVTQTATGPLLLASSAPVAVGPTGEGRLAYATDQVCHR